MTTISALATELDTTPTVVAAIVDQLETIDGTDTVIADHSGPALDIDGGQVTDITLTTQAADDVRTQHDAATPDADPLHDIGDALTRIEQLRADLDGAMSQRDAAIRAALTAGHPGTVIAERAGMTRQQVYTIRDGGRHRS